MSDWQRKPLPSLDEFKARLGVQHRDFVNHLSAYSRCLELETSQDTNAVMHARVLGYLILHAPNHDAQAEVVRSIHACAQDNLGKLGEVFVKWVLSAFRKRKDRTPIHSDHSSRPAFDRVSEILSAQLKDAPKDHKEAKAQALIRDGCRCIISGTYDSLVLTEIPDTNPQEIYDAGLVETQCAHIVPASTHFNVKTDDAENPSQNNLYASLILAVLQRFGYPVNNLNGPQVHSLSNVMTLEANVHNMFDQLKLWLEPMTTTPHHYRVVLADPLYGSTVKRKEATFTTSNPERFPLPSPELLALHAACAKVANLSGAAEYFDKFDLDLENSDVLVSDGNSSDLLDFAIWRKLGSRIDTVGA